MKYLNTLLNNHKEKTRGGGNKELEEWFSGRKPEEKLKGKFNEKESGREDPRWEKISNIILGVFSLFPTEYSYLYKTWRLALNNQIQYDNIKKTWAIFYCIDKLIIRMTNSWWIPRERSAFTGEGLDCLIWDLTGSRWGCKVMECSRKTESFSKVLRTARKENLRCNNCYSLFSSEAQRNLWKYLYCL